MGKDPAFMFYANDWLSSPNRLMMTPAERGAYIDLLCFQWSDSTCSLPDDDNQLAVLSGLGEGWFKGGSEKLRRCFIAHPVLCARISNPKLLELRHERDEFIAKSAAGGRKSGRVRRLRKRQKSAKGGSTTLGTKREPNANSSSSSSSSIISSPNGEDRARTTSGGRFTKPTVDEVRAYCTDRGNTVDPERFIDYYESNGWRVGRNPMKDWRATVRSWEKNGFHQPAPADEPLDLSFTPRED